MRFTYGRCKYCNTQMVVDSDKIRVICPHCGEICKSKESIDIFVSDPKERDSNRFNRKILITVAVVIGAIIHLYGFLWLFEYLFH